MYRTVRRALLQTESLHLVQKLASGMGGMVSRFPSRQKGQVVTVLKEHMTTDGKD